VDDTLIIVTKTILYNLENF